MVTISKLATFNPLLLDMEIKLVDQTSELLEILKIQEQNHRDNLVPGSHDNNGFVSVKHRLDMLEEMNRRTPQVVAKANQEVVGYALVMPKEFKELIPELLTMFKTFETLNYKGKKLSDLNYYVMGQIGVRNDFKRQGILKKLYEKHREEYAKHYDYCLTEVASRNLPSMIAHQKVGFKIIYTYTDPMDEWNIMLWDWT